MKKRVPSLLTAALQDLALPMVLSYRFLPPPPIVQQANRTVSPLKSVDRNYWVEGKLEGARWIMRPPLATLGTLALEVQDQRLGWGVGGAPAPGPVPILGLRPTPFSKVSASPDLLPQATVLGHGSPPTLAQGS